VQSFDVDLDCSQAFFEFDQRRFILSVFVIQPFEAFDDLFEFHATSAGVM
jgi:hypothetical protein